MAAFHPQQASFSSAHTADHQAEVYAPADVLPKVSNAALRQGVDKLQHCWFVEKARGSFLVARIPWCRFGTQSTEDCLIRIMDCRTCLFKGQNAFFGASGRITGFQPGAESVCPVHLQKA